MSKDIFAGINNCRTLKNRLFKNIGFLTLSQAANYVFPLITIPYVTRVVGPENYGMIEFATVAMLYFIVLVNFGFTTTATRKIAQASKNESKISFIFSTTIATKILLFFLSVVLFTITIYAIPKFSEHQKLMLYAFPIVFGWAIIPDFLFQGLQKLQVIALSNFVVKLVATILIFVLLKNPEEYYLVLGINAFAQTAVGIFTLIYAFKSLPFLKFNWPNWRSIKANLAMSRFVFVSQFFNRIYSFGSIIILGFLLSEIELGIYTASLKLIIVSNSFLFMPLHGALFPHLSQLFRTNFEKYLVHFKRTLLTMLLVSGASCLILMVFPSFFINIIFGEAFSSALPYVRIMAPIIIINTLTHFGLQQGILVFKKDKIYLKLIIVAAALTVLLNVLMAPSFGLLGASWVILSVEFVLGVSSVSVYYNILKKYKAERLSENLI